jgi:cell division protein FtsQ
VISGLVIDEPYPGMRLPAMFNSLFKDLDTLRLRAPELLAAVSEIKINRKSFDGFDLVLYPVHKQIRVRLSELNQDLLRYTLLMADVLAAKEPGINFIDFRSGMASYTLKEASSE